MLFKKAIYYYVPRCPECGSRLTGKYVKEPRRLEDAVFIMKESLKNGELITFVPNVPYENCYCEECNHEWHYEVTGKWIPKTRIEEEKKVRKTLERYIAYNEKYPKRKKSLLKKIFGLINW